MNRIFLFIALTVLFVACENKENIQTVESNEGKAVVYQVFTRLFGNTNTTNKAWGTIEENGVGKFNDFTPKALQEIKDLGVTHIWYTGILHHALVGDYTQYGISNDDPDVIKGRAGSPYAVKDYYNVNPDLAVNPAKRLEEFEALIERTHNEGLKVLIDIVPNHIARGYHSMTNPEGVVNFGDTDDTSVEYAVNNNFYYIPNQSFQIPDDENMTPVLGGEKHPLSDGKFEENPAKWTGNGSREAKPMAWDWYETVKVNYGIRPDGTKDFPTLPEGFDQKGYPEHYAFWQGKTVPDSWVKFTQIALYWTEKGVDGFRYDMAEMVPVEFWSYMNSHIKMENPEAFLLAEIYNPAAYRDYIHKGKMDYLYDKVELYDTLKNIIQGKGSTDNLSAIQHGLADIDEHMLHFLENHDEQRIASKGFAGNAQNALPAMVVSATISKAPTMVYFGQEVGEPGDDNAGFGTETRTTIFDYWGVPNYQRWYNNGACDGALLSDEETALRDYYKTLLNFTLNSNALLGEYYDLHTYNRENSSNYQGQVFSYLRYNSDDKLIILTNFHADKEVSLDILIPESMVEKLNLESGAYNNIFNDNTYNLVIKDNMGSIRVELAPLESLIIEI